MRPLWPGRRRWLMTVHQLTEELHRPPTTTEIARARQTTRESDRDAAVRAEADGHVVAQRRHQFLPASVRLTPAALVQLGVPMVVYLAWPVPIGRGDHPGVREQGLELARWATQLGMYPVSPYLLHGAIDRTDSLGAAGRLAARCDGVVVCRDRLLVSRSDVDAARKACVPVGVVETLEEVSEVESIWRPPRLVTSY